MSNSMRDHERRTITGEFTEYTPFPNASPEIVTRLSQLSQAGVDVVTVSACPSHRNLRQLPVRARPHVVTDSTRHPDSARP